MLASSWTSPLFPYAYGYDASWYVIAGRLILDGRVPYVDFFDLKGPAFFFYEALGQLLIRGRGGVYLLQCISVSLTALFLHKTARLFVGRKASGLAFVLFYFVYVSPLWGGNTVEELFMPFNAAAVYFALRAVTQKERDVRAPAFVFGVGAAAFMLSKATVAMTLFAALILVLVVFIRERRYRDILLSIGFFLFGMAALWLPVLFYFAFRHALKEFFYAVFVFAFKRSTDYYEAFSFDWEKQLFICPVSLLCAVILRPKYIFTGEEKEEERLKALRMLLFIFAPVSYALLHLGTPYTYYFISLMPLFFLTLVYIFSFYEELLKHRTFSSARHLRAVLISTALVTVVLCFYFVPTRDKLRENIGIIRDKVDIEEVEGYHESLSLVPEWERPDIFNLETGMIFYDVTDTLPANRYPVNCPYFMHLDGRIAAYILDVLTNEKPKWIMSEEIGDFDYDEVRDIVLENYEMINYNGYEELWRRIDDFRSREEAENAGYEEIDEYEEVYEDE
ncbi:MAG: glycosyltransferase family 39 protein [Lachnospiraceae bacterium]|nr:glycosyltransferase family 39 protein [Lachnospiraceae bacterium]